MSELKLSDVRRIIREELEAAMGESSVEETVEETVEESDAPVAEAAPKKGKVLTENLGFETPRNPGILPESYEQFRTAFKYAFEKMNMKQIAGRAMNLNESNSVLDGLERMWATVEREMTGKLGMPAPAFREGREFWTYFATELEGDLARIVEANLQGSKLVKGNSIEVARAVLDVLKAGS